MTADNAATPNPIRILVVDDHPVVRDGLVSMLETQPDFRVVGEAGSGRETLDFVKNQPPDVILLDLEIPELDGVETLKLLRQTYPEVQAIVFTAFDSDDRIINAVQAGAKGYLLKGAPREQIFKAVRVASQGGTIIEPVVATKLMRHIADEAQADADRRPVEALTAREKEVLDLLSKGMTNREIAAELVITERTVKFHVSSILTKLGASNRTEAVTLASQYGLIEL